MFIDLRVIPGIISNFNETIIPVVKMFEYSYASFVLVDMFIFVLVIGHYGF